MFDTGTENLIPFWGEKQSIAGGRDPLAVQNSSVIIYSNMIPGITNLTTRVRYMGFYCWLLNRFLNELEKRRASQLDRSEQLLYLRRSELLLAYIMNIFQKTAIASGNGVITGVGGTQYVGKNFVEHSASVDLKRGEREYWTNSQGVFGGQ